MKKIAFSFALFFSLQAQAQVTSEQKYFEWTDLPFPKEEYHQRREKLMIALKQNGDGIFVCPSRDGLSTGETYRQLDDFNYFTGLEVPNSVLVVNSENNSVILFLPPTDIRFESATRKNDFPGMQLLTDPQLKLRSGIDNLQSTQLLDSFFKAQATEMRILKINAGSALTIPILKTSYHSSWSPEEFLLHHLQTSFVGLKIESAYKEVAGLRMIKSSLEIQTIRTAANITMEGIKRAIPFIKPGVDERTLEGEMEAGFKSNGSPRIAFASIIKSGSNSLWPWRILATHYERRNRKMTAGELVIFDVGCEYTGYTSDMGRTFPVSGKFTDEQKQIIKMETAVSDAIIAAIKPGVTFGDLKRAADAAIPEKEKKYMQVGLHFGHHIGLSTGDPADLNAVLVPGMVFTVEPWYYNHDKDIAVFTEDEILVTERGAEVLTKAIPRTPEDIEAWMRNKK